MVLHCDTFGKLLKLLLIYGHPPFQVVHHGDGIKVTPRPSETFLESREITELHLAPDLLNEADVGVEAELVEGREISAVHGDVELGIVELREVILIQPFNLVLHNCPRVSFHNPHEIEPHLVTYRNLIGPATIRALFLRRPRQVQGLVEGIASKASHLQECERDVALVAATARGHSTLVVDYLYTRRTEGINNVLVRGIMPHVTLAIHVPCEEPIREESGNLACFK